MRIVFFVLAWILIVMNLLAFLSFFRVRKNHIDSRKAMFCWWGGVVVETFQVIFVIWAMLCH